MNDEIEGMLVVCMEYDWTRVDFNKLKTASHDLLFWCVSHSVEQTVYCEQLLVSFYESIF